MSSSFYDSLLEREARIIALDGADPEAVIAQFRLICRRSGRSIYCWEDGVGMISLKDSEISVPGSRPLVDALRYVLQSMHYGIYVMIGFEQHLSFPCVNYLKQLATQTQPDERKVILLGRHLHLPDPLGALVDSVTMDEPQPLNLRLRDGRWVMS